MLFRSSPNFPTSGSISLGTARSMRTILFSSSRFSNSSSRKVKFEGITLFDMDSFRMEETPAELQENLEAAGLIVRDQMDEFFKWLDGKELIPRIQEIKEKAVNDFNLRIMKPLKNTQMDEQEKEKLINAVDTAMGKVINKMLFALRDSVNEKAFLECVAGLEKTYEK